MTLDRDNYEDWIARDKRGGLSENEQRELREFIAGSLDARLLYTATHAFDRESYVVAGDDALIERIARQAQKRHRRSRVPVRSLSFGVAAGLLVAGAAVGAVGYSKLVSKVSEPAPRSAGIAQPKPQVTKLSAAKRDEPVAIPESSGRPQPPQVPLAASSQSSGASQRLAPAKSSTKQEVENSEPLSSTGRFDNTVDLPLLPSISTTDQSGEVAKLPAEKATPLSLFAMANQARVQGYTAQAVAEYEQLILTYPSSREAFAARISLGMLYLQRGQARQALEQFRTYGMSAGPLTADALWGEAQALRALGHGQEERQALERIVRDHPQSAYAQTAQARLIELR